MKPWHPVRLLVIALLAVSCSAPPARLMEPGPAPVALIPQPAPEPLPPPAIAVSAAEPTPAESAVLVPVNPSATPAPSGLQPGPVVLPRGRNQRAELNQIYAVARYRDWIVTASQGGVVVWDVRTRQPLAARTEFICSSLLEWGGTMWIGCYRTLLRLDGTRIEVRGSTPDASAENTFHLLKSAAGDLLARRGDDYVRYDRAIDRFLRVPSLGAGYDVLVSKSGEVWRIDFLHALFKGSEQIAIRGPAYPGRDPRRFYEDPTGRIWVCDFDDGFFRYDARAKHFVQEPGWSNKGSSMRIDAARHRTWLGHYTDGVLLKEANREQRFDLKHLQYMRDIFVDTDGSLWVGGWNALLHLTQSGSGWTTDEYVVR